MSHVVSIYKDSACDSNRIVGARNFLEENISRRPHFGSSNSLYGRSCNSSHILPPFVSATFIMLPHPKLVVNQDFCGILSFTFFLSFSASPFPKQESYLIKLYDKRQ